MHEVHKMAHCYLKPHDIEFYSKNLENIKIGGFEMSPVYYEFDKIHLFEFESSFSAPEIFDGKLTFSNDIWSLGIIAFLMLFGYVPFTTIDFDDKSSNWNSLNQNSINCKHFVAYQTENQRRLETMVWFW